MRGALLPLLFCLSCTCADGESTAHAPLPSPTEAPSDSTKSAALEVPADDAIHKDVIRLTGGGEIYLDEEQIRDPSQLRARLTDSRKPENDAHQLQADPALSWGQVSPVMAALAEPPGPGFIQVAVEDRWIELGWWSLHPGQVSAPDRGGRQTPLTMTLDLTESGLSLGGFELDSEAKAVEMVEAAVQTAPGGAVPVLLRVDHAISWSQILNLVASLDEVIGGERLAIWHLAPENP